MPVLDAGVTTRIGEGIRHRLLTEEPMRRTLEALERCLAVCAEHAVDRVRAVGTSAIRDARNSAEFLERAQAIGLSIDVLSGDDEARLSALAVRSDPLWRGVDRLVVVDIGGGSTEAICDGRDNAGLSGRVSLQLGAVRLTEACMHTDPPTAEELDAARRSCDVALEEVRCVWPPDTVMAVGVGGTVTNLGAVHLARRRTPNASLHGAQLQVSDVARQVEAFASVCLDERRRTPGLDPARADVITAGAIILERTLVRLGVECVSVSCRGLRWGVLYEMYDC